MNIVDTSGWLEYIGETDRAKFFIEPIESISDLIIPSIILYETFKKLILESDENKALISLAHMQQAKIILISAKIQPSLKRIPVGQVSERWQKVA